MMTANERITWWWECEAERRMKEQVEAQRRGDKEAFELAHSQYVLARRTLLDLTERRRKNGL